MPYTIMNKTTARHIETEVLAVLRNWAATQGLEVEFRGGTYDSGGSATFKIQVAIKSEDPNAVPNSPEATAFRQLARAYGFEPEDLGRKVRLRGIEYQIVGLKPRASRMPILLRSADGRTVKAGEDYVRMALGRAAA